MGDTEGIHEGFVEMSWRDEAAAGLGVVLADWRSLHGGCIAQAFCATARSGEQFFIKHCPGNSAMFAAEAAGLRALGATQTLRIPQVLAVGDSYLALEMVPAGRPASAFMETFGRLFAEMHQTCGETYGFPQDTWLGKTRQQNDPEESWPAFFYEARIVAQLQLAERNGYATSALRHAVCGLESRIDDLLATDEPPALLHGDLWSGNFLADGSGAPCIFDPAVYFGNREADLAMPHLFGGFSPAFFGAYEEAWPLPPGASRRQLLYEAYHMLNHLNLFGRSYYDAALSRLAELL